MTNTIIMAWLCAWFAYQLIWGNSMLAWAAAAFFYLIYLLGRILRALENSKQETTE
jgi:uncharacterized protein (DUF58 family)